MKIELFALDIVFKLGCLIQITPLIYFASKKIPNQTGKSKKLAKTHIFFLIIQGIQLVNIEFHFCVTIIEQYGNVSASLMHVKIGLTLYFKNLHISNHCNIC